MSTILPNNILKRMSREERSKLGKSGQLPEEIAAKCEAKSEREMQNDMANLLNQRNIFFVRSRTDKKTTQRRGVPDFLCVLANGMALAIEVKTPTGSLSDEQIKMHKEYSDKTGGCVEVVRSFDAFVQVINFYTRTITKL